jgi:hypothetical protein
MAVKARQTKRWILRRGGRAPLVIYDVMAESVRLQPKKKGLAVAAAVKATRLQRKVAL